MTCARLIRGEIAKGWVEVWHVPGEHNAADILTKAETPAKHGKLSRVMCGLKMATESYKTMGKLAKATASDFR